MKPRNSDKQKLSNWIKAGLTVIIFSSVISVAIVKTGFLTSTVSPISINHIFSGADTYAKPVTNPSLANPNNQTNAHGRKVVRIGTQIWMAENLNAGTRIDGASEQTDNGIIEKYCYNNNEENCDTDGGLYQWNEAMGYSITEGAQGICPNGWHIPTDAEWHTLENYLKDGANSCDSARSGWDCDTAGTKLKTGGSSEFNGILAGYLDAGRSFDERDLFAYFWSSTKSELNAWHRSLSWSWSYSSVYRGRYFYGDTKYGFSVRCIKDISLPDAVAEKIKS
jgi:uncharacterized protein (TIGR02145 family)